MAILTKLHLLKRLSFDALKRHFPVMPGWFSEDALKAEGELYKLLDGIADQVARFREAVSEARQGLSLLNARDEDADSWGADLEMPRQVDEEDADYTQRMQDRILQESCTEAGIIAAITATTGLTTSLIKPWEEVNWIGHRDPFGATAIDPVWGRSGRRRRPSKYYAGGVLDIVTHGYSVLTAPTAISVVSGGVDLYYTAILHYHVLTAPDDLVHWKLRSQHRDYYLSRIPRKVFGGGTPYSGGAVGRFVTQKDKSYLRGVHFNYWLYSSILTFQNLTGLTWEQALAGPIVAQPSPHFVVSADPE